MSAENSNSLHQTDKRILEVLQAQGRIPNVQLAAEVGLSPSAVLERVRKLEERGVIERYVTLLDHRKVGLGTVAFVGVTLHHHQPDAIEKFHRFVRESDRVLECYHLAGAEDYLLKVYTRDIDDYERFLLERLTKARGVDRVTTMFVLSTLKRETAMPLGGAESIRKGTKGWRPAKASARVNAARRSKWRTRKRDGSTRSR
jgi:Lrp/AsnC family leucine-responsive transcriptional regulator